ncbi:sulfotransferase [Hoeflea sp. TYP-13]|uniref:sulfotransferase n=1 Tax=Hoeflea sp. TYP-13 TaxID=3230023 RepID=UPI0034C60AB8
MKIKQLHRQFFANRVESEAFICGCDHSGTTLIANILAGHPDAFVPLYETYIFRKYNLKMQLQYMRLLREASSTGKRYLIEKTPEHITFIPVIRANIANSRFVIPVRDGRDVVASLIRRGFDLEIAIRDWIYRNTLALAEQNRPDVLVYRHEDLVKDPKTTIGLICSFLEIEYSDALLDFDKQERNWFNETKLRLGNKPPKDGVEHHALRNWQVNRPIYDSSGRWKKELREEDVQRLTSGDGRYLMEAFGYL